MRQNHTINRADVDKILGDVKPLSSMTHEIGMAAVAAELHLSIDELELDAANSVERGAAALFLAGFGPKPAASLPRSRTAKGSETQNRTLGERKAISETDEARPLTASSEASGWGVGRLGQLTLPPTSKESGSISARYRRSPSRRIPRCASLKRRLRLQPGSHMKYLRPRLEPPSPVFTNRRPKKARIQFGIRTGTAGAVRAPK